MTRLRILPLAVLTSLQFPTSLLAQEEAQLVVTEGSRVRLLVKMLAESERLVGTLISFTEDELTVDPIRPKKWRSEVKLSWDEVERLEVSVGRRPHTLTGALVGTGIGAATGAVVGLAICGERCELPAGGAAVIVGGTGAVAGFLVGMVTGAVIRTDVWQEVPVETLRVEPMISQGTGLRGIAVALRLRI